MKYDKIIIIIFFANVSYNLDSQSETGKLPQITQRNSDRIIRIIPKFNGLVPGPKHTSAQIVMQIRSFRSDQDRNPNSRSGL